MGFIIWIIVMGIIIYSATKGNNKTKQQNAQSQRLVQQSYTAPQRPVQQSYTAPQRPVQQLYTAPQRQVQQQYAQPQRQVQQPYAKQQRPVQQDIIGRAKANNSKLAEDRALKEIEQMHNHKEKQEKQVVEHSRNCQTLVGDSDAILASESILGSVDDLMVKGYSGNLQFERDFMAEAMDMLNSF